jgi:hypothetical protein
VAVEERMAPGVEKGYVRSVQGIQTELRMERLLRSRELEAAVEKEADEAPSTTGAAQ